MEDISYNKSFKAVFIICTVFPLITIFFIYCFFVINKEIEVHEMIESSMNKASMDGNFSMEDKDILLSQMNTICKNDSVVINDDTIEKNEEQKLISLDVTYQLELFPFKESNVKMICSTSESGRKENISCYQIHKIVGVILK